jgi:hypothetical protein
MDPKNNQMPAGASQTAPRFTGGKSGGTKMSKKTMMVGGVALVVVILAVTCFLFWRQMGSSAAIKGGQYQALFLTNGQVYFGKLSNVDNSYVRLTDIYYLQVQQNVQPADSSNKSQPKVSLAKLGSELHGPEDQMEVNRDQVLFWENLKADGKVANAIRDNQKK